MPPPVTTKSEVRDHLGSVAFVALPIAPEIRLEGFSHGKAEGGAKTAGNTLVSCLGSGGVSCSGSACGAALILWVAVCGVATSVAVVVGASSSASATAVQTAQETVAEAIDATAIQEGLRRQVAGAAALGHANVVTLPSEVADAAAKARAYGPLAAHGVDTVVETSLTKVGSVGRGSDPPLRLYMIAHVRIVRARDNAELFSANYSYDSERRRLQEWSENQGEPVRHMLETGYARLGAHIYEQLFLLYPFPYQATRATGFMGVGMGLAPLDPPTRGTVLDVEDGLDIQHWTTVGSLQPTLRWETFPRDVDLKVSPEAMGRVRNVTYDLVIAEEKESAAGAIVYVGTALPTNNHALEEPLKPKTKYYWTVRARFDLDGRQHVTEWATTAWWTNSTLAAPSWASYRFRTGE